VSSVSAVRWPTSVGMGPASTRSDNNSNKKTVKRHGRSDERVSLTRRLRQMTSVSGFRYAYAKE